MKSETQNRITWLERSVVNPFISEVPMGVRWINHLQWVQTGSPERNKHKNMRKNGERTMLATDGFVLEYTVNSWPLVHAGKHFALYRIEIF